MYFLLCGHDLSTGAYQLLSAQKILDDRLLAHMDLACSRFAVIVLAFSIIVNSCCLSFWTFFLRKATLFHSVWNPRLLVAEIQSLR